MRQLDRQRTYHIGEPSEIAVARRAGNELGIASGFDETRNGELALLITEAATNIAKHAQEGHILLRAVTHQDARGVEVIAIDQGPGIANLTLQMEDGNSTAGTYGVGLGAIQRLAHEYEIFTEPNKGTAIYMVLWNDRSLVRRTSWRVGAVCLPMAGEEACGDAWAIRRNDERLTLLVVDGIGHGVNAEAAANVALETFAAYPRALPAVLLHHCHGAMMGSRGGAVAIASIDPGKNELRFAGIGNVAGLVIESQQRRHLISHNGIVGNNMRKVQEFSQEWQPGSLMILHTDGINTRWDLDQYPGLAARHPSLIAAVLYRDSNRGRDDATIVVLKQEADA